MRACGLAVIEAGIGWRSGQFAKLDAHWAEQQRIHRESAINEALAKGGIHD